MAAGNLTDAPRRPRAVRARSGEGRRRPAVPPVLAAARAGLKARTKRPAAATSSAGLRLDDVWLREPGGRRRHPCEQARRCPARAAPNQSRRTRHFLVPPHSPIHQSAPRAGLPS